MAISERRRDIKRRRQRRQQRLKLKLKQSSSGAVVVAEVQLVEAPEEPATPKKNKA
ncbi:MAG: hypothetical protein ACYDAI_06640 [Trichloromonadaceae bacterium]